MDVIKRATLPFVKIYNFIQREFAYSQQVDSRGFIPFGPQDNFPNELSRLVQNSPTATACLSTLTDFITGEGFNQGKDLENRVINARGLKLFQFHNIQADSLCHNWGVASLVKYSKAGKITEIYDIPFGYCRLGRPDSKGIISKIFYNPYFGTGLYRPTDTVEYDVYNPQAALAQAQDPKFKGQINWLGVRDSKHPFYPIPDYYSAHHWMNVEKNTAVYFDENLENGFLTPSVIKLFGNPNDPSGIKDDNDDDIPKGKVFDDMMTKNFSGAERVGKIMAFWGNNKEEWPELEAFPSNANAETYKVQDEHATKKITIATKVPGILANIAEGVSLGGDGNTIRAAVKLMQQRAIRPQNILVDYYSDMLKNMVVPYTDDINVVSYNPFPELESVDPQVWDVLTPEEKRQWVQDHTEIDLIEDEPDKVPSGTITNLHFDSYPAKARDNVKRALEWQAKMGTRCLKPGGKAMSEAIMNGLPLGPKEIKRLSRYLSKQTVYKDHPYDSSCESVEYDAWGGSEMMVWANEKKKELDGKTD
jgi:hypothetical protein